MAETALPGFPAVFMTVLPVLQLHIHLKRNEAIITPVNALYSSGENKAHCTDTKNPQIKACYAG